jgi:hypothetical protein
MKKTIAAIFITMLLTGYSTWSASPVYARGRSVNPRAETPRFEDFPVAEQFRGKPAAVRLATREARKYRTMIREGAREGPNFAGHYTLIEWGCGAGCVRFAVVDAKTGAVFMPPFYVGSRALVEGETGEPEEPLQFRVDSRLLIVSGSQNEKGEGVYYYKWDKNRLALFATGAVKKP